TPTRTWTATPAPTCVLTLPTPTAIPTSTTLHSIAQVSDADAWVVGDYTDTTGLTQPLIEHLVSDTLHLVAVPSIPGNVHLWGAAVAANEVWAVGEAANGGYTQTLTLHWNGSTWSNI